ncbi:hypothetical protein [Nonomuraea sp. NPDC048916]|uniref:hypothetical protein n=1 Tax=Nonomuraea sp. NPDC048916 TaxID=3154232 RepID=UPI00340CCC34
MRFSQLKRRIFLQFDPAHAKGLAYMLPDGTLISIDCCAEPADSVKNDPIGAWYAGKAHQYADNLQALPTPGECGSARSNPAPSTT